ncbi:hypothetical protein CH379_009370 [Leptospira ellisii]|uniref:Uncharacterized protein n=1 Tax=Leptospira ellisii TaxID=2023197 RepID=A0A2N0BFK8_9LEPT|nr:hypothetical protein [Leptospira ellisii]MDV6235835.1 hypothetical protein [Leptospira ellisii]PJZ93696.1 hypothetical protein CH379_06590 [Leptospira ellisii]PKA02766.1 hypothetical protein CH375_21000 [Leptospira ellisii]
MDYILKKLNKIALWINPSSELLEGESAWIDFDPNLHEIVFSPNYGPCIGNSFEAGFAEGKVLEFESKKVYEKKRVKREGFKVGAILF